MTFDRDVDYIIDSEEWDRRTGRTPRSHLAQGKRELALPVGSPAPGGSGQAHEAREGERGSAPIPTPAAAVSPGGGSPA